MSSMSIPRNSVVNDIQSFVNEFPKNTDYECYFEGEKKIFLFITSSSIAKPNYYSSAIMKTYPNQPDEPLLHSKSDPKARKRYQNCWEYESKNIFTTNYTISLYYSKDLASTEKELLNTIFSIAKEKILDLQNKENRSQYWNNLRIPLCALFSIAILTHLALKDRQSLP